ncbi:MAG: tRNA 2-thiouridine(34) synthase MnmA [Spirochaetaceae bacterium]|jgi:tRNA-specific 2-thiouridylase|nr:tRNA 2-thiouridine(34) synthase MnmA [Spirochaetaceae bacterium]
MTGKVVIAMSGGVDSSVAAWIMKEQGRDCIGITLKLFTNDDLGLKKNYSCCSLEDVNDARNVAYRMGMPHYTLNFSGDFRDQVIRRFVETYEQGGTPNPCIDCNRYIKFESLLRRARQLDFETIVTGHYARIERDHASGRFLLKKARDSKKDQSYVLYCLTQEQLAHTVFPLGDKTKDEVREIALARGFVNAKKHDSQDICFVPDRDYPRFIETYRGKQPEGGNILDGTGAVLGRHRGLIRYTIGQRRGVGLSFPGPMYVAAKSVADNTLTLGPEESLYSRSLTAGDCNFIACADLEQPRRVRVKTRYLQAGQEAVAEQVGPRSIRIDFDEPQRAITPGQAAVLYDGDYVVGGGTILGDGPGSAGGF